MVFSWREMLKFIIFVAIVVIVAFYISANREHLIKDLTSGGGTEQSAATSDAGDQSGETAGQDGEIVSVGSFEPGALTAGTAASAPTDMFVEFRLQREQARSEQLDLLREVLNNPNLGAGSREEAAGLWLVITEAVAAEVDLENLIRAKGFADAVVVLDKGRATIMVKAASLTQADVLRIADLATRVAGLSFEDITVMAKGG